MYRRCITVFLVSFLFCTIEASGKQQDSESLSLRQLHRKALKFLKENEPDSSLKYIRMAIQQERRIPLLRVEATATCQLGGKTKDTRISARGLDLYHDSLWSAMEVVEVFPDNLEAQKEFVQTAVMYMRDLYEAALLEEEWFVELHYPFAEMILTESLKRARDIEPYLSKKNKQQYISELEKRSKHLIDRSLRASAGWYEYLKSDDWGYRCRILDWARRQAVTPEAERMILGDLVTLARQRDSGLALQYAQESYMKYPEDDGTRTDLRTVYLILAIEAIDGNRPEDARNWARQATEVDPGSPEAWAELAEIYAEMDSLDAAVTAYGQAWQLEPVEYYEPYKDALLKAGHPLDALEVIERERKRKGNEQAVEIEQGGRYVDDSDEGGGRIGASASGDGSIRRGLR